MSETANSTSMQATLRRLYGPVVVVVIAAAAMAPSSRAQQPEATPAGAEVSPPTDDKDATDAISSEAQQLRAEQLKIGSQLLEDYPEKFDAWRIMGYVHSSLGNQTEMAECWRKCRELKPDRADTYDQLGRHAFQTERYEEAVELWQRAFQLDPQLPGVQRRIGEALLKMGQANEASAALKLAVILARRDPTAHQLLGEAHFQLQDFDAAKESYATAAEIQPSNPKAHYGLMKVCGRLGQTDEMREHTARFQELQAAAAEADKEFRLAHDDRQQMREQLANTCLDAAKVYSAEVRADRAKPLLVRTLQIRPEDAAAIDLLAGLYLHQNKPALALEQLHELARLQPSNSKCRQQIGFLHASLGQMAEAEKALAEAVENDPEDASNYRALAKFYLNSKRKAKRALLLSIKAARLEPVAESLFVLGWSHAVNGNRAGAEAALDKAIALDPENANYRQLRQAIGRSK